MHLSVGLSSIVLVLFAVAATGQGYGDCVTPNKEPGSCIPLQQCTPIYTKLESNSVSNSDRVLFSQSQCGYRDGGVLICCPKAVLTESRFGATDLKPGNWLPKEPDCPKDFSDRIVGGVETGLTEFPWMAMIEYTKPDNSKNHHCGGALINHRYVVTAAHCVSKITPGWRLSAVRLGEWDTTTDPDCENGQCAPSPLDVAVEEAIVHPQYSATVRSQYHDIALLRLAELVPFNQYIEAICLPDVTSLRNAPFTSYTMDVCGWGATENGRLSTRKLKASVSVNDLAQCSRNYATQGFRLESAQMCAGGKKNVDSCRGDSGGPLIHLRTGDMAAYFYLAGVVSFGPTPCGLEGWSGVYTRVGPYVNWIKSTIKP